MASKQVKKELIVKKLIKILKKKGVSEFQAKVPEYPSPNDINYNGSMKKFSPDLISISDDDKCDLYEVETGLRDREIQDQVAKWILFSNYSKRRNGEFTLIVPESNTDKFEQLLNRMMINAKLMPIESIA